MRPRPAIRWMSALVMAVTVAAPAASPVAAASVANGRRPTPHATFTITNCTNDTQLRNAVTALQSGTGGGITFQCGTATIPLSSNLPAIEKDTSVNGGGTITINGMGRYRAFTVRAGALLGLRDIRLINGYQAGDGGSIWSAGSLILNHLTITSSKATGSGGAIATTGSMDMIDSTISNGRATRGGAIFADTPASTATILRSSIIGNIVSSTQTAAYGGGIWLYGGASMTMRDSDVANNEAYWGGGVALIGAAYDLHSSFSAYGTRFRGNSSDVNGGAIGGVYADITLGRVSVTGNDANAGGGISSGYGQLTLTDATISGNAARTGGGLYVDAGEAEVRGVTISGNGAQLEGGGIANWGTNLRLINSTVSGNRAGVAGAGQSGGGMWASMASYSPLTVVTNTTFSGNSATAPGGGIATKNGGAHLVLRNTIVSGSTGGNCAISPAPYVNDANLSSDATCGFGTGRDSVSVGLAPLANNGGPTQTHLPSAISPAIDKGTPTSAPGTDQRGTPRPQGPAIDVGAVERGSSTVDQEDPYVRYDGWVGRRLTGPSGGSYRVARAPGSSVTFTFTGTRVTWLTRRAPSDGIARVSIDGVAKPDVNLYRSAALWQVPITYSGLANTTHTIRITVTGTKSSSATDSVVVVDGFIPSTSTVPVQDTSTALRWASWNGLRQSAAAGGTYRSNGLVGPFARFTFVGTAITFVTAKGPSLGVADVLIDGTTRLSNYDFYAAEWQWQFPIALTGLSRGTHTIEIRPKHVKNASSSGYGIIVDAFRGLIDRMPSPL